MTTQQEETKAKALAYISKLKMRSFWSHQKCAIESFKYRAYGHVCKTYPISADFETSGHPLDSFAKEGFGERVGESGWTLTSVGWEILEILLEDEFNEMYNQSPGYAHVAYVRPDRTGADPVDLHRLPFRF